MAKQPSDDEFHQLMLAIFEEYEKKALSDRIRRGLQAHYKRNKPAKRKHD